MNFLLLLYLSYVRGPRLLQEQREREGTSREKKKNLNNRSTCKKCDGKLSQSDSELQQPEEQCAKCHDGGKAVQGTGFFIWFQVCVICIALAVFVYRTFSRM